MPCNRCHPGSNPHRPWELCPYHAEEEQEETERENALARLRAADPERQGAIPATDGEWHHHLVQEV